MLFNEIIKNNDTPTHGKANKGFSGLQSVVSRIKFTNGGYERSPQSLTCLTAGTLCVMLNCNHLEQPLSLKQIKVI
jgi:hypothetical protein